MSLYASLKKAANIYKHNSNFKEIKTKIWPMFSSATAGATKKRCKFWATVNVCLFILGSNYAVKTFIGTFQPEQPFCLVSISIE